MLAQNAPRPQPVAFVTQTTPAVRDSISEASQNHPILFHRLGVTQILLGVVSIVLGITLAVYANIYESYYPYPYYNDYWGRIAPGVWCGSFFFTTGLLGVLSARYKNRCLVVASLTMAIFSTLSAATLMGISIAGAVESTEPYYSRLHVWMVSSGIHSTQTVIGFAAFVISIVHAAYCCNCNGCESSDSCCMPTPTTSGGFVNQAAIINQPHVNQPIPSTYVQTRPVHATQVLQQPVMVTTSVPHQPQLYQVQHPVPQTLFVPQTQPQQLIHQQQPQQQQGQQQQQQRQQQQQQQQPQQQPQEQQRRDKSDSQPPAYEKEAKF